MKFRDDYGVYICSHILRERKPILEGIRDPDGNWQFLCGQEHDFDNEECHLVEVGHLVSKDSTVNELTILQPGEFAERESQNDNWQFGELEL